MSKPRDSQISERGGEERNRSSSRREEEKEQQEEKSRKQTAVQSVSRDRVQQRQGPAQGKLRQGELKDKVSKHR